MFQIAPCWRGSRGAASFAPQDSWLSAAALWPRI